MKSWGTSELTLWTLKKWVTKLRWDQIIPSLFRVGEDTCHGSRRVFVPDIHVYKWVSEWVSEWIVCVCVCSCRQSRSLKTISLISSNITTSSLMSFVGHFLLVKWSGISPISWHHKVLNLLTAVHKNCCKHSCFFGSKFNQIVQSLNLCPRPHQAPRPSSCI